MWRGSRDSFGDEDIHRLSDGQTNTQRLFLDTAENVFHGFTPLQFESPDPSIITTGRPGETIM
jgi:hypothetical protein